MQIAMPDKGKQKPLNFYIIIQDIVSQYEFEMDVEQVRNKIVHHIQYIIKRRWPKVSTDGKIFIMIEAETYRPRLNLSPILIKDMELYYPEALI